jgi:choline dehydrogenase-like flavoprotein
MDGSVKQVYAKREVIMAAGSIFTPQILQLSGIGPSDVLKAAGINVKKNMPAVGANMQDHPNANMVFDLNHLGLSRQGFYARHNCGDIDKLPLKLYSKLERPLLSNKERCHDLRHHQ